MTRDNKHNQKTITSVSFLLLLFFLGYFFCFFSLPRLPVVVRDATTACPTLPPPPPTHDLFDFNYNCTPPIEQSSYLPTVIGEVYNNTSPFLDFPPPHLASLLRHRHAEGWGSNAPVFEKLIESVRPATIIEVGTFMGASALHMAEVTRRHNLSNTLILCLDDFRGWPGFRSTFKDLSDVNGDVLLMQQFMQNIVDAGEQHRIIPVPFASSAGLAVMCRRGVYADLIEIDAGHDFHSAWQDINLAWKVLRPGGTMFGHDYFNVDGNHGVQRAVDLFAKVTGLTMETNGEHWVLSPKKE